MSNSAIRTKMAWLGLAILMGCTPRVVEEPGPAITPTATATSAGSDGGSGGVVKPEQVIEALKGSNLPIGRVDVYTEDNDPTRLLGRPRSYIGKAVFHDTRYKLAPDASNNLISWQDWGGTTEIFGNKADLDLGKKKIKRQQERFGQLPPEYQYENGLVLLRLAHVFTPGQAKEYESALKKFNP